jgi:hypothetical protein
MPRGPLIALGIALLLSASTPSAGVQVEAPDKLRIGAAWRAGEKQTYQVQQVVKERSGGAEETRFLSNGTLEITAVESTPDTVAFTWHRRMDNAALELVREPWGIHGNAPYEKLLTSTVTQGLPLAVKLDLRTRRARIENLDELATALSLRLQSIGGETNPTGRRRPSDERNTREPSNAALGIQQPLVRHEVRKYANTPRNGKVVATWYARLSAAEIEDLLAFLGSEFRLEMGGAPASDRMRVYRPTSAEEVLVTLASAPAASEAAPELAMASEDEREAEPKNVGIAGSSPAPVAKEAKVEVTLASGWPKRAAITRTEADGARRTTLRRVYLRQ